MKFFLFVTSFILLNASNKTCKNKKKNQVDGCYKAKLEVKGGCMNYTIAITEGKFDSSKVLSKWTDENTGKTYNNVFALGSRCTFPSTINEGDEFYFTIDTTSPLNCAVCMMYYPVPSKKLSIKVLEKPCTL